MLKHTLSHFLKLVVFLLIVQLFSCRKFKEYNQKPEMESLQQGLKTCTTIGYCVSIASSALAGNALPDNVIYDKSSGLIYIKIDEDHPLPFNRNIGDIVIACLADNDGGLMSVLFGDIDILGGNVKLYGLYTVPFTKQYGNDDILAFFAKQDIVVGNGSDTLLNISKITDMMFNSEMNQLNTEQPTDPFVAVKQNIWFINIDQGNTFSNVYDDIITINGGGQVIEVKGESGGIIYHSLIKTKVDFAECLLNPISGNALSQNVKAGGILLVDLGNSLLSFHNQCDGKAHVDLSTGKYISYNGKDISLDLY